MKRATFMLLLAAGLAMGAEPTTEEIREKAFAIERARPQEALSLLEEVVRREPQNPKNYVYLGDRYKDTGRMNDALLAYEAARRLNPDDALIYQSILNVYWETKDWKEFERYARELVRVAPDDYSSYHLLAEAREEQGDLVGALQQYQKALAIDPSLAQNAIPIGNTLVKLGRLKEAEAAFRYAFDTEDGDDARIQLAELYLLQGRPKDAETLYRDLKRTWPESAPYLRKILDAEANKRKAEQQGVKSASNVRRPASGAAQETGRVDGGGP